MNTDSVEVCGAEPDAVLARVSTAVATRFTPAADEPMRWYSALLTQLDDSMLDVHATPLPIGYDGPTSWMVELRSRQELDQVRAVIQRIYDALADGTDWQLIWWSDDEPDDGIVRERRSTSGPNMPTIDEQNAIADRNLTAPS